MHSAVLQCLFCKKKVVAEGHDYNDSAVIAECWIPPYGELRAVTKRFNIQ